MYSYIVYAAVEKPRSAYNERLDGRLLTVQQQRSLAEKSDLPKWVEDITGTLSVDGDNAREILMKLDTPAVSIEVDDGQRVITRQYFVVTGESRDEAVEEVKRRCSGRDPQWEVLSVIEVRQRTELLDEEA